MAAFNPARKSIKVNNFVAISPLTTFEVEGCASSLFYIYCDLWRSQYIRRRHQSIALAGNPIGTTMVVSR